MADVSEHISASKVVPTIDPIEPKEKAVDTLSTSYDVYARPYIPEALKAVNRSPAFQVFTQPIRRVDFRHYVSTFAGSAFLSVDHLQKAIPHYGPVPDALCLPDKLTADMYVSYWLSSLQKEAAAQTQDCDDLALWSVPIISRSSEKDVFGLLLPGLREGNIHIEVGDNVYLRQLRIDGRTGLPFTAGDRYDFEPSFTGLEYVAVITRIDRRQEMLDIRVDGLVPESLKFNVRFGIQTRRYEALQEAVATTRFHEFRHPSSHALSLPRPSETLRGNEQVQQPLALHDTPPDIIDKSSWFNCMLFPTTEHAIMQNKLNPSTFSFGSYDMSLNFEQLRAIDSIISNNYGTLPYLISGPPGTGKTKTLVEATLQLVSGREHNVLLCAPSDPAADILALRLSTHLKPDQLFRLNDPYRTFAEVPERLLIYCCIDNELFSIPSFIDLMSRRVVVTTCRDARLLVQAHVTNENLTSLERRFVSTLHPNVEIPPVKLHWSALIVDEAAQATEPEALISMSVVRPPSETCYEQEPIFIMAGDQKQLNPRTASKDIAIETSLFERLFDRDLYRLHPLSRSQLRGGEPPMLRQDLLPMIRPPFANLVRNYRSHPVILAVPSALFYNDTLIPEAAATDSLESWQGWRGRGWPVLFCQNESMDDIEAEGGGSLNIGEAHRALQYARQLVDSKLLAEQEICIISPFQAQVRVLRHLARSPKYKIWGVNVSCATREAVLFVFQKCCG